MKALFKTLADEREGATAIEYGLIAALVAVTMVPVLLRFSDQFKGTYDYITVVLGGTP